MDTDRPSIEDIWRRFGGFMLRIEARTDLCEFAQAFQEWGESALNLHLHSSLIEVARAKVYLVDKYFEWFSIVPKKHRYHLSPRGHTCIFHVFIRFYRRLKVLELSQTRNLLVEPPPPPLPPQIAGIFIGEEEE